ncbi:MAG TPA: PrsW family glutamic-type intramembrane protease [Thermoguttaceae bacterium]|nr:PrsW family glutamic-type intramembrane protease [Thermoguttaceae bacterium]
MDDKYFSVDHEPALTGGRFEPDPAERRAKPVGGQADELELLRDSVAAEPALPQYDEPNQWSEWLQLRRRRCTLPGNLAVTLLAALLGGPFAVVGALVAGRQGMVAFVYVVVFGPIVEELLKQSGMTYVLEKKPYRVFAAWQFVFAAVVSGLAFAVIENLVYIHVYARQAGVEDVGKLAAYRWVVCTSLHVVCAAIASLGLIRAWRRQLREGRPVDLGAAFPWFVLAIVVHGTYNFAASFITF